MRSCSKNKCRLADYFASSDVDVQYLQRTAFVLQSYVRDDAQLLERSVVAKEQARILLSNKKIIRPFIKRFGNWLPLTSNVYTVQSFVESYLRL